MEGGDWEGGIGAGGGPGQGVGSGGSLSNALEAFSRFYYYFRGGDTLHESLCRSRQLVLYTPPFFLF